MIDKGHNRSTAVMEELNEKRSQVSIDHCHRDSNTNNNYFTQPVLDQAVHSPIQKVLNSWRYQSPATKTNKPTNLNGNGLQAPNTFSRLSSAGHVTDRQNKEKSM